MPSVRHLGFALLLLCLAGCGGEDDANAVTNLTIGVTGMVQELGIT